MHADLARLREELRDFYARRLPDPQDAEDFTQRVFERALAGSKGTDRSLLFEIAKGLLKNEYRDRAREAAAERPTPRPENQFEDYPFQGAADRARLLDPEGDWGTTASPSYTFEDADFAAVHDRAVRDLDPALRDAYIVTELRGLSSREAEPVLGISHVTANARRTSATAEIRRELSR